MICGAAGAGDGYRIFPYVQYQWWQACSPTSTEAIWFGYRSMYADLVLGSVGWVVIKLLHRQSSPLPSIQRRIWARGLTSTMADPHSWPSLQFVSWPSPWFWQTLMFAGGRWDAVNLVSSVHSIFLPSIRQI